VGLDNLITGSLDNVAHLDGNGAFTFVKHDVSTYIPRRRRRHSSSPAPPKSTATRRCIPSPSRIGAT
jgi:dTDP-glucose 4,6-dehydratase